MALVVVATPLCLGVGGWQDEKKKKSCVGQGTPRLMVPIVKIF